MGGDDMVRITPEMGEEEILRACVEAALETSPDSVIKQLQQAAAEHGLTSTLDLIKASMREERGQHDMLEGWLATLAGRIR